MNLIKMKMARYSVIIFANFCYLSCSNLTSEEKDILHIINKKVEIGMFDFVIHKDSLVNFEKIRNRFDYISIVFLENGCSPCYTKYVEWQNYMDSTTINNKNTVLFVLNGESYETFINKVNKIKVTKNKFYIVEDFNYQFLFNNIEIPRWIIRRSILINKRNEIKMVGEPFVSEEMKILYENICAK